MPSNIELVALNPCTSDGDSRKWPSATHSQGLRRDDNPWLERLAQMWMDERGERLAGVSYCLEKFPAGYGVYGKNRKDSAHVDRYMYGHPKTIFRSSNEFYEHFKYLMDHGSAVGCTCKICGAGGRGKRASVSKVSSTASPQQSSSGNGRAKGRPGPSAMQHAPMTLPSSLPPTPPAKPRGRQVDEEGTQDIFRALLDRVKAGHAHGEKLDERIEELMSPDWRMGHEMAWKEIRKLQSQPRFAPRTGEVVLFVRNLGGDQVLAFDPSSRVMRIALKASGEWLGQPRWEAGVVTQIPGDDAPISEKDLTEEDPTKRHAVSYSGFRVEPVPEPGNPSKPYSTQHKYLPLHQLRPFVLWKECLKGIDESEYHPTIKHGLTISSSLCLLQKYHIRGMYPEATVFCHGAFVGPELICIGDVVLLMPSPGAGPLDILTDILVVTAVKLRFVRLDEASDDDYDDGHPYNTCMHISGHGYTLDPARSFDGMGKVPINRLTGVLPEHVAKYGNWYHLHDPTNNTRYEVPLIRVMGRCYEDFAMSAWFHTPANIPPPLSFQAVNASLTKTGASAGQSDLSTGYLGMLEARDFSLMHDKRIMRDQGKTYFWADTRIEQLDLDSVNDCGVGDRDELRSERQLDGWRKALRCLDGKKDALEGYHQARKEREEAEQMALQQMMTATGDRPVGLEASGMVASALRRAEDSEVLEGATSGADVDMEVDEGSIGEQGSKRSLSEMEDDDGGAPATVTSKANPREVVMLESDDEDGEDTAADLLVGELATQGIPGSTAAMAGREGSLAKKVKVKNATRSCTTTDSCDANFATK